MVQVLGYVADAIWILTLAIMASATRQAWRRVPADAVIVVSTGSDGAPALTTTRARALLAVLVLAIVAGLALSAARIWADHNALAAVALFCVRATAAALFALAHLRWLRAVLERLASKGALRS